MSEKVTYAAIDYWLAASEISATLRAIPLYQDQAWVCEKGMDYCTELEYARLPEWLKPRAVHFAQSAHAKFAAHHETVIGAAANA